MCKPPWEGGTPQYDDGGRLLRESALNGIVPLGEACKSNITENVGKVERPTVLHQVVPQGRSTARLRRPRQHRLGVQLGLLIQVLQFLHQPLTSVTLC